jgi:hypothetical protein
MRIRSLPIIVAILTTAAGARAEFINWTSPSGGQIGAVDVSLNDLTEGPELSLSAYDLTDTPFLAWPGAGDQQCLNFLCADD